MRLVNSLIQTGNHLVDLVLRVNPHEVLNNVPVSVQVANPASSLLSASKELQASVVDPNNGNVDYEALKSSTSYREYQQLASSLADCTPDDIGIGQNRTAFWINIYNALIIDAVIHYNITGSLLKKPGLFRQAAYNIGGMRFSADDIEHGILRGNRPHPVVPLAPFGSDDPRIDLGVENFDPRIHFALVCGARSCPPIKYYDGEKLDVQLDLAASSFINGEGARYDQRTNTLWLSRIFKWYQKDFGKLSGVIEILKKFARDEDLLTGLNKNRPRVRYMEYDWTVNN